MEIYNNRYNNDNVFYLSTNIYRTYFHTSGPVTFMDNGNKEMREGNEINCENNMTWILDRFTHNRACCSINLVQHMTYHNFKTYTLIYIVILSP